MCARSRRLLLPAILGAAVAVSAADPILLADQPSAPAEEDLLRGTWNLDVARSKYYPGPAPKSQTRTYEAHPDGVKATIKTVYADGQTASVQYVASYDGIEYPVLGSAEAEAIALKRVDAYTAQATLSHAGKVIGTARRVLSKDGKTMTITFQAQGGRVNNVAVYRKEQK